MRGGGVGWPTAATVERPRLRAAVAIQPASRQWAGRPLAVGRTTLCDQRRDHDACRVPVCVDCEHWSPGTFKSCPDCSGVLKLEPLWARSSKDAQLDRLDWETKWWHRHARDETSPEAARAEAWSMVADLRHRYEGLRRRLLPVLELAEARRVQRMEAGARAAGVPVKAYEAKVAREERAREQAAHRSDSELWKAYNAGLLTHEEHERRQAEVWSALRAERGHDEEAAAVAEGLSIDAYRRRAAREQKRRERLWGNEGTDPEGGLEWLVYSGLTVLITGVVGLIVAAVFLLTGRSPLAAIAGTILGGLAGWLLCSAVFFLSASFLDRRTARSWMAQHIIEPVSVLSVLGILVLPPVLAVLVALWLG